MITEHSVAVQPNNLANAKAFLEMQPVVVLGGTVSVSPTYGLVVLIKFDSEHDYSEAVRQLYPLTAQVSR